MLVRVALRESTGTLRNCPDTTPEANFDNIGPLASCAAQLVTTPVDLIVSVFDVNESKLPGTVEIQSQFQLTSTSASATLPFFRLNGMAQSISGQQADVSVTATVTMVPPAFRTNALTLSRSSIDTTLRDTTIASNSIVTAEPPPPVTYPSGVQMRLSVQAPTGAITNLVDGVVPSTGFNLDWDGRINGQAVPAGTYTLRTTLLATGQTITAPVTVTTVANVFEIQRASPDPWNARAGPVSYAYRMSPAGSITRRVEGPSAAGSACTLGPLPVVVPDSSTAALNAGNGIVTVPVTTSAGRFLPPGNYCVRFRANGAAGNLIGTQAMEMNVSAPTTLRLSVNLNPAVPWILPSATATDGAGTQVPIPAGPVFVEVKAFDDKNTLRPTGQITVRAIPFLTIPVPPGVITSQTCTGVSVCRMQIGLPTLTRATDVIFDASAGDLPAANPADPPPQMAVFPQRAAALIWAPQNRAGPVSVPVAGSIAAGFSTVARSRTQDVAFHAGTGFDLAVAPQATQFSDGIGKILDVFFGGDPAVGANSITADQGRSVAFWLTRTPAVIDTGPAGSGAPGAPLCRRTQLESVPFADMQAVIHSVNCRDNADWNHASFSAEFGGGLGRVAWHEFHHAAYDLADEYPPDGGYYQSPTLPNVMSDAAQCALNGAEPLNCTQIGMTAWWRAAPIPDVMINNTRENLDDLRRAVMMQNTCSTGRC